MDKLIIKINCRMEEVSTLYVVENATVSELKKHIDNYNEEWESGTYEDSCYIYLKDKGVEFSELEPQATFEI